jgi:flagellar biosynthesis protein FlhF
MNVQVIKAPSRRTLLSKAKRHVGPDALILSVRKMRTDEPDVFVWEAVVATEDQLAEENGTPDIQTEVNVEADSTVPDSPALPKGVPEAAAKGLPSVAVKVPSGDIKSEKPEGSFKELRGEIAQKIETRNTPMQQHDPELIRIAQRLAHLESDMLSDMLRDLQLPMHLVPVLNTLYAAGYPEGDALRLVAGAQELYRKDTTIDLAHFCASVRQMIANELPIAPKQDSNQGMRVFVGSSGVGKTALAIKLAAELSFNEGHRPIIGIVQPKRAISVAMVRRYAEHLGCNFVQVRSAQQFAELEELAHVRPVILDSSPVNPMDHQGLRQLKGILDLAPQAEVHAVVPATYSAQDIKMALDAFSVAGANRFSATRLDESPFIGRVLSASAQTGMPLGLLSNGPRIPDDLMKPQINRLLDSVFHPQITYAA